MRRNDKAAILAFIEGALFLLVGYSGARGVDRFFDLLQTWFPGRPLLDLLARILGGIASLGGIAVIAGGYLFHTDRVRIGRILVLLGSGAGLTTLILFLLVNVRREAFSVLFAVLPALVGVVLGIAARFVAEPKSILP